MLLSHISRTLKMGNLFIIAVKKQNILYIRQYVHIRMSLSSWINQVRWAMLGTRLTAFSISHFLFIVAHQIVLTGYLSYDTWAKCNFKSASKATKQGTSCWYQHDYTFSAGDVQTDFNSGNVDFHIPSCIMAMSQSCVKKLIANPEEQKEWHITGLIN